MPIGASSVKVINGTANKGLTTTNDTSSSTNLGLILGLCIPIGTLCKIYINFSNYWCNNIDLEKK